MEEPGGCDKIPLPAQYEQALGTYGGPKPAGFGHKHSAKTWKNCMKTQADALFKKQFQMFI